MRPYHKAMDGYDTMDAGLVLIGNELLTGKIQDENGPYLTGALRRHGIDLGEAHVISDEIGAIAEAVNIVRSRRDLCFTSGGIGPTHDDVTLEAVATAFGVAVEERPELVRIVDVVFGVGESARAWRKMARVPVGCELRFVPNHWPVYVVDNVYVLPGIPQIFRRQLDFILSTIEEMQPVATTVAYMKLGEGELTGPLADLAKQYAGQVEFGSYPIIGDPHYQVKVTLDSRDREALAEATKCLLRAFPPEALHELVDGVEMEES